MKVVRRHTVANAPTPPRIQRPRRNSDVSRHYEPVYVSSSSTVYIGSDISEQSDGDSSSYYYCPSLYQTNKDYQKATLRSIFYEGSHDELQEMSLWMEDEKEASGDEQEQEHEYEPLYACVQDSEQDRVSSCSQPSDSFDDSFDSDFEDPYYIQEGLDVANGHGSVSAGPTDPDSATGMNRIRETAGQKIRKFRRSWSVTKNDISSKISKIRKKSVGAVTDVKNGKKLSPSSDESQASSPEANLSKPRDAKDEGSRTWSLKGKFKRNRVGLAQVGKVPSRKESATFYLTLTIQPDSSETSDPSHWKSDSDSIQSHKIGSTADSSNSSTKLKSRPSIQRPKIAPPDPPSNQQPLQPKRVNENNAINRKLSNEEATKEKSNCHNGASEECGKNEKEKFQEKLNNLLANQSEKLQSLVSLSREASLCSINERQQLNGFSGHHSNPLITRSVSSKDIYNSSDNNRTFARSHSTSEIISETDGISYADVASTDVESYEEPMYLSSHFADEPLYQFYTATIIHRNTGCSSDEDDYEVIEEIELNEQNERIRPSAMELVGPHGPQRTLWCELKEVQESGILDKISDEQKKLQEAVFELLTSEASYLKSLHVLVTHFANSPKLLAVISKRDWHILFSDIVPVKEASEKLLLDLEARWQKSVYISDVADILYRHSRKNFDVYVRYCSNQVYQERLLNELKTSNAEFVEVLRSLESHPVTQSLSMHSFLMLPMQRITRLPLLVDAIYHRLEQHSVHLETTKLALAALNKVVHECNEGARKMERMQEMLLLSRQLDWGEVKVLPLISASRWLVKRGEVTQLVYQNSDTYLRTPKFRKLTLHLFLFTDLLVVTKKRSGEEERYLVLDHCPRNMVHVTEAGVSMVDLPSGVPNLMMLTMLCNRQEKTKEMLLSCSLESERSRWIEAVTPRQSENPEEVVYEEWDCPQVQAVHSYTPVQPDELALNQGDVVKVLKKTADGWYQGERLPDGVTGWFPGNYSKEISSAHVRARYLHQRYRLLQLSESFLEKSRNKDEEKPPRTRRQSLQLNLTGSKRNVEKKKKISLCENGIVSPTEFKQSINSWKQRVPV